MWRQINGGKQAMGSMIKSGALKSLKEITVVYRRLYIIYIGL